MHNKKFYVTTPLYYVNAKPHLGTLYSTLLADVIARFKKLSGQEVFFLTGTDEHGQKLAQAARDAGKEPRAFVDEMVPYFKAAWQRYGIEYTKFIRTTDAEHEAAVIAWITKMQEQGDIYKATYSGLYCVPCESFVSAKGVQACPTCGRPLKTIEEENYFFRLSAYQDRLLAFYEKHPTFIIPKERFNEAISFVKNGLDDLSISRKGVAWGIPFPGDPSHTVYVWADALLNYVSAIGYGVDDKTLHEWWPADVQVMAKDIVRFHAIYFPAFLMAAGVEPAKQLLVHGYILTGEQKMSKSLGNVVDPLYLADTYGHEPVRYYLLAQMSVAQDGHFALGDLEGRIESDLANSLGNLLNRVLTLSLNNGLATVPAPAETLEPKCAALHEQCGEAFRDYWDEMSHYQFHLALGHLWRFIHKVNAFINEMEPWKLAKESKDLFAEVMSSACHSLHMIGHVLWPVMPKKMEELLASLGVKFELGPDHEKALRANVWHKTFSLSATDGPLFVKPELKKQVEENPGQDFILIDDFAKVQLHVGQIRVAVPVQKSEKLLKLEVDFGPLGTRQILAGVKQSFAPDDLIGLQGVFVLNLPPRKMAGEASEGMMLFAKDESGVMSPVTVKSTVANGARLS